MTTIPMKPPWGLLTWQESKEICIFDGKRFRNIIAVMHNWHGLRDIVPQSFTCAFCGRQVASAKGWDDQAGPNSSFVCVCPNCTRASVLYKGGEQYPAGKYGDQVNDLPADVQETYEEARSCMQVNAFTASALLCRKVLMHIAVEKGAKEGLGFTEYIDYLEKNNLLFPGSKDWVDHIRKMGNDATHKLATFTKPQAEETITFTAMLLKLIYEFPAKLKPAT